MYFKEFFGYAENGYSILDVCRIPDCGDIIYRDGIAYGVFVEFVGDKIRIVQKGLIINPLNIEEILSLPEDLQLIKTRAWDMIWCETGFLFKRRLENKND